MIRHKYLISLCVVMACAVLFYGEVMLFKSFSNTLTSQKITRDHSTATAIPDDYNSGITILGRISPSNDTNSYPPDFDIIVLNHTDEPITFWNKGFGLEVVWGDGIAKEWKKVNLHPSPEDFPTPVTLAAHTDESTGNNLWTINGSDIKTYYHYNPLRAYVGGYGQITGTHYIAYWDILVIEKPPSP
jgi:hypothetical protein